MIACILFGETNVFLPNVGDMISPLKSLYSSAVTFLTNVTTAAPHGTVSGQCSHPMICRLIESGMVSFTIVVGIGESQMSINLALLR